VTVWAVCCQKGGVGKTTTAVTLGGLLAQRGRRVLLVDMDPQGSLSAYFGVDPQTVSPSLFELFAPQADVGHLAAQAVRPTGVEGLMLLPASTALATLERRVGPQPGMGRVLQRALEGFGPRYDFVLFDNAPSLGVLLINALAACDQVLIPVQTEYLALHGLERMLHTLEMVSRSLGRPLPYTIVPTFYDARTRASADCLDRLRRAYAASLWPGVIPVDTKFREAARARRPLSHCAPATARGLVAYAQLLEALLATARPAPDRQGTAAAQTVA
jgi:chromosome partitioning protein